MRSIVNIALFLGAILLTSPAVYSQNCDCLANLNALSEQVSKNYVGYQEKVLAGNNSQKLDHLTKSLRAQATRANALACYQLMQQWISFFEDPHLVLTLKTPSPDSAWVRNLFAGVEQIPMKEQQVKDYLSKGNTDPIEGIWEDNTRTYQMAIVRESDRKKNRDFVGFTLIADGTYWQTGQVKAEITRKGNAYQAIYYPKDHRKKQHPIQINGHIMEVLGSPGFWTRTYPKDEKVVSLSKPVVSFKQVDGNTSLLTILSFRPAYKAAIDSVLEKNWAALSNSKQLIIDLRNNPGGYVLAYEKLMPLIATGPVKKADELFMATEENLEQFRKIVTDNNNKVPEAMIRETLNDLDKAAKGERNKPVLFSKGDTQQFEQPQSAPARIAILVNEVSASATEIFIMQAKQSKKVIVFGTPTSGAVINLDPLPRDLPCTMLQLLCPVLKADYGNPPYLVEGKIKPDVQISPATPDWIEYAKNYLENLASK